MATVLIRNLEEELVAQLKRRAAANNRSLEGELRHILLAASKDQLYAQRSAFRVISTQLRARTRGSEQLPSELLIRQDRDLDHGV